MKHLIIKVLLIVFTVNLSSAQAWMTNLEIAQKLALVQNKMVLMVWEETTKYPYPFYVKDDRGRTLLIQNLFEDETVTPLIWKHFVPVIISENQYADLYLEIKGKRNQSYIEKFNDDSIKIMDVNGNIINASGYFDDFPNITKLIEKYSLNTKFLELELAGYKKEKTFYSAYYLASKYLDYAMYCNEKIRPQIINLASLYLDEALIFVDTETSEEKETLIERVELLRIQQNLVLKRPKKVLRQLKRIDIDTSKSNTASYVAFLYYTAYSILEDEKKAKLWKAKTSSVNLKKAQMIINLNS